MDFEEVGNGFKKLFKNKFFVAALVVVILMAIYSMTRKGSTRYSSTDVDAILSSYPINGSGEISSDNAVMQSEMVYSYISEVETNLQTTMDDLRQSIVSGNEDLRQDIYAGMLSTAGYFEQGMAEARERDELYHQSILDTVNNLGLNLSDKITDIGGQTMDRIDFLNQSVMDKADAISSQNSIYYDSLQNSINTGFNNMTWRLGNMQSSLDTSIKDSANAVIIQTNNNAENIKNQIDMNRKQENQEHAILSENLNTWGSRLWGK